MEKQIEDEINLILDECHENGMIPFYGSIPDIRDKAITRAEILGLIKRKNKGAYELSIEGLKVLDFDGGVREYLMNIESKEEKDDLIRDLSIKDLKGNIFQFKLAKLFFVLNVIASFIAGNFELVSKWFDLIR
ncbi:hypothetical protein [Cyclobacterium qasimii]|uniref:Uncharacterized protein n=2 Tax=Cyclobacterium qasimii TaxID=1350429 RepID=S7VBK8_9BACT|nr:hypothetical protein [Cyclobacterium qasimii]EPR67361.1 hypothetical protein ADICYQ_3634 [Cyclobacterium qasimii M12-11B]GEO20451.1 hypothetical protein CQA01_09850 [Cyclobacterium qasimii]